MNGTKINLYLYFCKDFLLFFFHAEEEAKKGEILFGKLLLVIFGHCFILVERLVLLFGVYTSWYCVSSTVELLVAGVRVVLVMKPISS